MIPWYADTDGDGLGDPDTYVWAACSPPEGYLPWPNSYDCNPSDPSLPGNWYQDYDGDGYGSPTVSWYSCDSLPGYVRNAADCMDLIYLIFRKEFSCSPGIL